MCRAPGPGALCRAPALCVGARHSLCRGRKLFVSGPGALYQGPLSCVSGSVWPRHSPAALMCRAPPLSASGPASACHRGPQLSPVSWARLGSTRHLLFPFSRATNPSCRPRPRICVPPIQEGGLGWLGGRPDLSQPEKRRNTADRQRTSRIAACPHADASLLWLVPSIRDWLLTHAPSSARVAACAHGINLAQTRCFWTRTPASARVVVRAEGSLGRSVSIRQSQPETIPPAKGTLDSTGFAQPVGRPQSGPQDASGPAAHPDQSDLVRARQLRSACHPFSPACSLFQERTPNLTAWGKRRACNCSAHAFLPTLFGVCASIISSSCPLGSEQEVFASRAATLHVGPTFSPVRHSVY